MKVQARVEKELFRAVDKKKKLKQSMTSANILINEERIRVLTWLLSDLDVDLHEVGE